MTLKERAKLNRMPLVWMLLLLMLGLISVGITVARYVVQTSTDNAVAYAEKAYFTSDKLKEGDYPLYRLAVSSAADAEISFKLRNYADYLRVSEADIKYTIYSSAIATTITGNQDTISGHSSGDKTVTLKGFAPDIFDSTSRAIITVTATSAPYSTTLGARFELYLPIEGLKYTVYDAKDASALTMILTTGSSGGDVVITYPEGVYPDRTNPLFTEISNGSCTFNAKSDAEYSLTFFKSNPTTEYMNSSFKVNGLGVVTP